MAQFLDTSITGSLTLSSSLTPITFPGTNARIEMGDPSGTDYAMVFRSNRYYYFQDNKTFYVQGSIVARNGIRDDGGPLALGHLSANIMYLSGSSVGIGTSTPSRKLHIGGAGGSSGGIMLSPSSGDVEVQFQDSGTTNAYITLKDGTQQMRFRDDSANVLNVDFGTERVGIGTTSPAEPLHVIGDGRFSESVRFDNSNSIAGAWIGFNSTSTDLFVNNELASGRIKIRTANSDGILLDENQDVTIYQNLTVEGIVTAQEFHTEFVSASIVFQSGSTKFGDTSDDIHAFTGSISVAGNNTVLTVKNNAVNGADTGVEIRGARNATVDGVTSYLNFTNYDDNSGGLHNLGRIYGSMASAGDNDGTLTIQTYNGSEYVNGIKIHESGNTGIGGTLRVGGTLEPSASSTLDVVSTDTPEVYIRTSAISNQDAILRIRGSRTTSTTSEIAQIRFETNDEDAAGIDLARISAIKDTASTNVGRLEFKTMPTDGGTLATRMTIKGDGSVGIGTTNPAEELHVVGNVKFDGTRDIDFDTQNGNVRIKANSGGWATGLFFNGSSGTDRGGFGGYGTNDTLSYHWIGDAYNTPTAVFKPSSGNVGIGTTSPSQKLHVAGTGRFDGNITYVGTIYTVGNYSFNNDANTYFGHPAADTLNMYTAGSERLRVTSGGQLIVGGTTVGYAGTKLQVGNTSDSQNGLNILTSTTGNGYILFGDGSGADTYVGQIRYKHGDDFMSFNTSGSERIRINSSGNVGIGTSSPGEDLHVEGPTAVQFRLNQTGASTAVRMGSGTSYFFINAGTGGDTTALNIMHSNKYVGIGTTAPSQRLAVEGNISASGFINVEGAVTASAFKGDGSGLTGVTATIPLNEVLGTGNDGGGNDMDNIGAITATSLSTSAEVTASYVYAANDIRLGNGSRGHNIYQNYMSLGETKGGASTILGNNVKADIDGNNRVQILSNGSDKAHWISLNYNKGITFHVTSSATGTEFDYLTGELMRLDNSGNLGIGITSPDSKVHIEQSKVTVTTASLDNGTAVGLHLTYPDTVLTGGEGIALAMGMNGRGRSYIANISTTTSKDVSAMAFYTETGGVIGERLRISPSGNVGIGTSSPAGNLHVNGTSLIFTQTGNTYTDASSGLTGIGIKNNGNSASYNAFGINTAAGTVFQVRNNGDVKIKKYLDLGDSSTNTFGIRLTRTNASVVQDAHLYSPSNNSPSVFYIEGGYWTGEAAGTVTAANSGYAYYERYFGSGTEHSYKHFGFVNSTGAFTVTDLTASLALKANGNVGIGTTSPGYKLEVNASSIKPTADLLLGEAAYSTSTDYIGLKTTYMTGINDYMMISGKSDYNTYISAKDNAGVYVRGGGNNGNNQIFIPDNTYIDIDTTTLNVNGALTVDDGVTIGGDLTVDGIVTAQEFHTEFVSASIMYDSGSTKFGDTSDDVHSFTGSLKVDGTGTFDAVELVNGAGSVTRGLFSDGTQGEVTLISPERVTVLFDSNNNDGTSFFAVKKDNTDPSNATELFRVDSSGNVGIGTDAPTAQLHVTGSKGAGFSAVIDNSANNGHGLYIKAGGTSGTRYITQWKDAAGTERFHMDDTGEAYFQNDIATDGDIIFDNNNGVGQGYVKGGGDLNLIIDSNNNTNTAALVVEKDTQTAGSGTELFRVQEDGNVGIGTTTPDGRLNIRTAYTSSASITNDASDYAINVDFLGANGSIASPQYGAHFAIRDSNGAAVAAINGVDQGASGTTGLSFLTGDVNGLTDRLHITNTGNVGIGTSSPAFLLSLDGSTTNKIAFQNGSGIYSDKAYIEYVKSGDDTNLAFGTTSDTFDAIERMRITHDGKVGIGTTSPSVDLEVAGTAKFTGGSISIGNSNSGVIYYNSNTNTNLSMTSALMRMKVGNITMLSLSEPSFGQDEVVVNDDSNNVDFRVEGNNDANLLFTEADTDRVGIGTNDPEGKLMVRDDAAGSPTRLIVSNGGTVQAGTAARLSFYEGGDEKNYIERRRDATGQLAFVSPADDNPFVFENATGEFMRMVNSKVGIGTTSPDEKLHVAAGNIKVGEMLIGTGSAANSSSLAIGQDALAAFTGSTENTAVGFKALESNTASGPNDAFGAESLRYSTAATYNVGFGYAAGLRSQGTQNTYIGQYAGPYYYDVTGGYNVMIGTLTGLLMSGSSHHNTGIGTNALYNMSDADSNTSIGAGSGFELTTGEKNTFIGRNTGRGITTGDANTIIGVVSGLSSTLSNTVIIADGDGNKRLYVNSSGDVGIGTTSPDSKLEVADAGNTQIKVTNTTNSVETVVLSQSGDGWIGTQTDHPLKLGVGYSAKMFIGTSGNVGIGTTSPDQKLHVNGKGLFDGNRSVLVDSNLGNVRISAPSSGGWSIGMFFNDASGSDAGGFGTYGTATALEYYFIGDAYNDTTMVIEPDAGNVGIGTTTPSEKLHVAGTGQFGAYAKIGTNISAGYYQDGANGAYRANGTSGNRGYYFQSYNGSTTTMYVGLAGTYASNVGIGTTTPDEKLHVAGNVKATNYYVADNIIHNGDSNTSIDFDTDRIRLYAGGSVKIDTNNTYLVSNTDITTRGITPGADRTHDIGSDSERFRVIYCETLDSAGLHESNLAEGSVDQYTTGTVLVWRNGTNTPCTTEGDHMRMGIAVNGNASPLVQGAEPVLVTGPANEGDYLITSDKQGHAKAISRQEMLDRNLYDCVIGKALEDGNGESYLLKVWITI